MNAPTPTPNPLAAKKRWGCLALLLLLAAVLLASAWGYFLKQEGHLWANQRDYQQQVNQLLISLTDGPPNQLMAFIDQHKSLHSPEAAALTAQLQLNPPNSHALAQALQTLAQAHAQHLNQLQAANSQRMALTGGLGLLFAFIAAAMGIKLACYFCQAALTHASKQKALEDETHQQDKALEAALLAKRHADERLHYALSNNGDGIWDWDLTTNKVYHSDRLKAMLGLQPDEMSDNLNEWQSRIHPADKDRIWAEVDANMQGRTDEYTCEHRMLCKNGHYIWILDRGRVVSRSAEGKPLRMVGTYTDLSSQKAATKALEAALRESSALLNTLNRHAIISVADPSGRITDVNDAFCNISEYSRAELIGQQHSIVNSGHHPKSFWISMWQDIASGKPWRHSVCNRAKSGRLYWVDTFIAPFKDEQGGIEKYISIRIDITQAKTYEQHLQAARDQFRKAAEVAQMGVWRWDITSGNIEWNERMHEIYEKPNDVRASSAYYDYWVSCLHPEDAAPTLAKLDAAVNHGQVYNPVFRIITPSGQVRFIQAGGIVEYSPQGQPLGMMGINIDITEQHTAQLALHDAKQAAENANQAKSAFLANMSHELRTPMNAILGMLALLNKTELTPRQADYSRKTEGAARALLGLLNDILDLSKAEAGKMTLDPHPFSLTTLMRDLSVILSATVSNKPVEVLFDIAKDVPKQWVGDALRLQQVLVNLGGNAIKFTPQGTVVVRLEVQAQQGDTYWLRFSVTDTGIGIAPENQTRIFEGFSQAETTTSRRYGGTGLGLAISNHLVQLMGGELKLHSQLGQGSQFYFTCPFQLAPAKALYPEEWPNGVWRVLVVDDNPTTLDVLNRTCESLGWQVDTAASGQDALALLHARTQAGEHYHAIFMDWQMPGLDGWETSRAIRQMDATPRAPIVIMITAYDREMLAKRSETEQVLINGFLVKPVTASMLVDAVMDAHRELAPKTTPLAPKPAPRLTGLQLLLVEDNLTNQQVAFELLESEGAKVQIANNGQEAVDYLSQNPAPDCVLMDIQMPVMDGFTATRRIREHLKLTHLPIIAMTANAMAKDKSACLEAGMNDHLGKPFDLDPLVATLLQHSRPAVAPPGPLAKNTPENTGLPLDNALKAAGFDKATALARMNGNEQLYLRLIPNFIAETLALPAELNTALSQSDWAAIQRALHTFKGLTATMALTPLASLCAQQYAQLNTQPTSASAAVTAINQGIAELEAPFRDLLEVLKQE